MKLFVFLVFNWGFNVYFLNLKKADTVCRIRTCISLNSCIINNFSGKVRPQPGAENKRVQTVREQKVA